MSKETGKMKIIVDLLSTEEVSLLYALFEEADLSSDVTTLQPLERFGEKAKKLFLVYFDLEKMTRPFVVKIAAKSDIQEELGGIKHISLYVDDAKNIADCCQGDIGALLYKHAGATTADKVGSSKEFGEVAYDLTVPIDSLICCLNKVYSKMETAHRAAKPEEIDLLEKDKGYEWYLRNNRPSRIEAILGELRKVHGTFEFLGAQIYNPLYAIREVHKKHTCKVGPVHGDLHPKNIILDGNYRKAGLIDFAWSAYPRHTLVDYTLLENSLRFMLFPGFCSLPEQLEVDKLLLSETGYSDAAELTFSTDESKQYFLRLTSMLRIIRQRARSILDKHYDFTNYLLSQFIVLYGLLKIDKYHPYITVRALGLIAQELLVKGVIQRTYR